MQKNVKSNLFSGHVKVIGILNLKHRKTFSNLVFSYEVVITAFLECDYF